MNIERNYYQKQKEMQLSIKNWERVLSSLPELSPETEEQLNRLLQEDCAMLDMLETEHPRIKSPEREQQFEAIVEKALFLAEVFNIDIHAYTTDDLNGNLELVMDELLLFREYKLNFLPMLKKLMDMCDQYYVTTIEKYGDTLIYMSFTVPLYVRGISI